MLQRFKDFGQTSILSYSSKTEPDMQNPSIPLQQSYFSHLMHLVLLCK